MLLVRTQLFEVIKNGENSFGAVERMLSGCRATRNEMIKDVMRDYRYLEHSGMGIPFKIVRLMKEHNGTEPTFILDHEQVKLQLWLEPKSV